MEGAALEVSGAALEVSGAALEVSGAAGVEELQAASARAAAPMIAGSATRE
ncbi:unannotated protein [freshwater metagenome]|uniref:Unannotated protein n=1 Tax=freshwater metagenome TaxID=449393 RepID=A0A6J7BXC5_9ZZZZ